MFPNSYKLLNTSDKLLLRIRILPLFSPLLFVKFTSLLLLSTYTHSLLNKVSSLSKLPVSLSPSLTSRSENVSPH